MLRRIRNASALLATVVLGASASLASETVSGPELRWDLSLWGKQRAGTEAAESLARHVLARTEGRWTIQLHYGEALSKSRENLDGLAIGAFEAAMFCNFYHPKKNPALMVLSLPFLPMSGTEQSLAVREAVYAHPAIKREMARWGARLYVSSLLPQYEFMGRGKPPRTLEDWKGKTVRAGGGLGQAMRALGAAPTSSPATEVYTGLQQGTMDAAAMPFTYAHISYRLHEVSEWYTSNLSPGTSECPIAISERAYKNLVAPYKQLLDDIRPQVIREQQQVYATVDQENLPMIETKLVAVKYDRAARARFKQAGLPVIEQWIVDNEGSFDSRDLVETVYRAAGESFEPK
ncbi:MAG: TRAP transporter substrate-binding protein DctP [Pseudomonadales bacterium]|nr:TRAP transporter substrate-binding protein DctP [Pseudomonadales bacterium]